MKISYNILNTFFDGKLPAPAVLEEAFTFHSWEIDEVIEKDGDTMFDVKVLPDKSAWALSHRGVAKDLSVVLGMPLAHDLFTHMPSLSPRTDALSVRVDTPLCDRYAAAYVTGVVVGPSPEWLVKSLATLGQRSINNIVDATNYVMFMTGQPLHAFDAGKLSALSIGVRTARDGEKITTLTGDVCEFSSQDALIVDGGNDTPLGIAGIKGGKVAEVDQKTTDLVIESAHFNAVSTRKTAQRLKLRTDASVRYENGIVSDVVPYALEEVVRVILEIARGSLVGYVDTGTDRRMCTNVFVSLSKINSVLGLSLSQDDVEKILVRFGYPYTWSGDVLSIIPPFERPDLVIAEDIIEEIGRMHGYDHVVSVTPSPLPLTEINTTFYYTDMVRRALQDAGFSEIFTSSFRAHDVVKLKNALASDKGYLRSALAENMKEALARNAPNADLLGVREIATFEVGTVFTQSGQHLSLALGVSSPSGYKAKNDEAILKRGMTAVETALGVALPWTSNAGIAEVALSPVFMALPVPTAYAQFEKTPDITYRSFSQYPFASRDVAFWSPQGKTEEELAALIKEMGGALLMRLDLFDRFEKEGRVSYAFRLVFQSFEKTLTEEEITLPMEQIYTKLKEIGCEVR